MNWKEVRRRYCYPETKDGVERYYAVVHGQSVEINMPLHHLSLIQHKQKYQSHHGQRFIQIAVKYFEELDRLHPMPQNLTSGQ